MKATKETGSGLVRNIIIAILSFVWGCVIIRMPEAFVPATLVASGLFLVISALRMRRLSSRVQGTKGALNAAGASSGATSVSNTTSATRSGAPALKGRIAGLYPIRSKIAFALALLAFIACVPQLRAYMSLVVMVAIVVERSAHLILQLFAIRQARASFRKKSSFWADVLVSFALIAVALLCLFATQDGVITTGLQWGLGCAFILLSIIMFALIMIAPKQGEADFDILMEDR